MNVLFLTLIEFDSFNEKNIYTDLLREFIKHGHHVCAISPVEKRKGVSTNLIKESGSAILRLQIGNVQKTNFLEKGISTLMIEPLYKNAIKKYFSDLKFDLVVYSTPPITLFSAIEYVKKRDCAKTYLLLKDIFPQNALDIGALSTDGFKGVIYRHFRKQEKKLYNISDRIGCMSEANAKYVLDHNPEIDASKVEVCPNSIEIFDKSVTAEEKIRIREKYGIPRDDVVFVYGGNLGRPQGIPFLIECLKSCEEKKGVYFFVVGDGTDFSLLDEYIKCGKQNNLKLMKRIPKDDYDTMVGACDVGMIFLDHRFTIPNYPSRILSYMQAKLPVLAVTDPNTDIGKTVVDSGFGWWCESNDSVAFSRMIDAIIESRLTDYGTKGFDALTKMFDVKRSYTIIENFVMN